MDARTHARGKIKKFFAVATREIRDRADGALHPQQLVIERCESVMVDTCMSAMSTNDLCAVFNTQTQCLLNMLTQVVE